MKRWKDFGAVVFCLVLFLGAFVSCGGGGSDGGGLASLEGTWFGWIEDDEGTVQAFDLRIDGEGDITEVRIGGLNTGDTGNINEGYDENVFHLLYTGNLLNHGVMIVDNQASHAAYGDYGSDDSTFYLGVLQKGTIVYPAYASSDIVGNYPTGGAFEGNSGLWEGDEVTIEVDAELDFTGSGSEDSFAGSFGNYDGAYGRYGGELTVEVEPPETMDITAYISPDGEAVAAFVKESDASIFPLEDFLLIGLKR